MLSFAATNSKMSKRIILENLFPEFHYLKLVVQIIHDCALYINFYDKLHFRLISVESMIIIRSTESLQAVIIQEFKSYLSKTYLNDSLMINVTFSDFFSTFSHQIFVWTYACMCSRVSLWLYEGVGLRICQVGVVSDCAYLCVGTVFI